MRLGLKSSLVVLLAMMAALPLVAQAQDVVVPYVAPRAANTRVMLPDGSTVRVELALTDAEQAYGLMGRTNLPEGGDAVRSRSDGEASVLDVPLQNWAGHCVDGRAAPDRGDEPGYATVQREVFDVPNYAGMSHRNMCWSCRWVRS